MALFCKDSPSSCSPERKKIWKKEENRSQYYLEDADAFNVCWIDNEERCKGSNLPHADHIFLTCQDCADMKKLAIVVELKGSDVVHGCRQIIATINELRPFLESYLVLARLITTRTPKVTQRASVRNQLIQLLASHAQKLQLRVAANNLLSGVYKDNLRKLHELIHGE